ncbi:MAG: hypothetical protein HFG65_17085 [Hungatella sp.]|jgi:tetratricopeptide (TPR) repeat protein|nr:hypothetical protein [Hungatella sp.]
MKDFVNPFPKLCEDYANRFDVASDNNDIQTIRNLLSESEDFLTKHLDAIYAPLYYCMGTSYGNLRTHGYSIESDETELPLEKKDASLERELYCFRHCLELLDDSELSKEEFKPYVIGLKLQVYTNYANALENCGRRAAAMKFYRKVLEIDPKFGMAEGNIGRALQHYSALVHDSGHMAYLNHFAYNYLKSSLNNADVHEAARIHFERCINSYTDEVKEIFLEKKLDITEYSLGGKEEESYRRWCLHNHLFLNPLNDLPHELSCFAIDSLQLPDILTPVKQIDPPKYFGMFNQLKQEYIYARYLCYEAFYEREEPHFADKETCLLNLYDFPQYSIRIEGLKTAFRQLYSIFDKVAFFVNEYWELGIHERDINYRTIWLSGYGDKKKRYEYKNILKPDDNIALKSMLWIYNEFNKKFGDADTPYAKNIQVLRNALEHKFVKVYNGFSYEDKPGKQKIGEDSFYHITEDCLLQYTMDLLEIVREWLIDLTMAVHTEEIRRGEDKDDIKSFPVYLMEYADEWKV